MKKIIVKEEKDVIGLSQITNDSSVGILWENSDKSFITEFSSNMFVGIRVGDLSLKGKWTEDSKQTYIKEAIKGGGECFFFETVEELREWMRK